MCGRDNITIIFTSKLKNKPIKELKMNFKEVKEKIRTFVNDELISLEPWIVNSDWSEKLPKLNELREKVKKMGFWLPQVSKVYGVR